jgi:hypothetical protein
MSNGLETTIKAFRTEVGSLRQFHHGAVSAPQIAGQAPMEKLPLLKLDEEISLEQWSM